MSLNKFWDISEPLILIDISQQTMTCYKNRKPLSEYKISSAKNGVGEIENSGCTPRGWHEVSDIIGLSQPENAVFVGREWTGELYSKDIAIKNPNRDWILTRILRLRGLEPGINQGPGVDSYNRYIYIHGTPDDVTLGVPGSHGCIRMRNKDVMILANWAKTGLKVYINTKGLSISQIYKEINSILE
ncbi:MAG: L,D-transpeptidase [Gammaproteobacteria bacterium]|nr:L,D-transpeptidase [Gammaproteobacteria bacterium]